MIGQLAESWEIFPGPPDPIPSTSDRAFAGTTKAPMNGRQFTAHDVEYNFHRLLGMGDFAEAGPTPFAGANQLKSLPWEPITATDDATVVIKVTEPRQNLLRLVLGVVNGVAFMMPPRGDRAAWRR